MVRCDEPTISKYVVSGVERVGLGTSTKVLDVPCGFGRHAHWFAERGCKVVAADIDAKRIEIAARDAPKSVHPIQWLVADLEQELPLFDGTFDLVVVVHYFSQRILNRAAQALRPGGHLIFETFGGHGQNWVDLPKKGWCEEASKDCFRIVHLKQRAVGPNRDNYAIQMVAERLAPMGR